MDQNGHQHHNCHCHGEIDLLDDEKKKDFMKAHEHFDMAGILADEGKHLEAETLLLEAKDLCENSSGPNTAAYAFTVHSLGETQVKIGKLDDAEASFLDAIQVRTHFPPTTATMFMLAMSRDALAQKYEIRGDYKKARELRMAESESMICSFNKVSLYKYPRAFNENYNLIKTSVQ